ncbi:unnamed protein product [Euphydryas editha]|uniref:TRASH domain-containing protein n=1 Tax=Euphydryas editha TaxID=104508 RepID=A0AAU9U7Z0_EUPED|nr:unnamed protein product [Euphydryas editha]
MDDKEVSDSPDKAVTVVDKDLDKIEVTSSVTEDKVAANIAKVTESDDIAKVTESDDINSDIKSSSNVNSVTLSDVQNSVDHENQKEGSDESYETLKTTVADKVNSIEPAEKHEIPESKDSENTLKEEPSVMETSEEKELKTETATETIAESGSPENDDKETISKPQTTPSEEQYSENKDEDDDRTDDRKPEFETAPNCSIDEQQEDHTQASDPFDALLKDRTDTATETETATQSTVAVTIEDDDDDHHNADQSLCDIGHDDDIEDDHPPDDDSITEIVDQPGADEEVCLLPDTEREISEADKAAAEKVLAEKRKRDEEAALAAESAVPKEEAETETAEAAESISEEPALAEDASESVDADVSTEDVSQENGGDKENENEEATEPESNQSNTIQQISPVDATCYYCKTERSCQFRYKAKDGGYNYLCELNCVKLFQNINPGQYLLVDKKYMVEEIIPRMLTCSECEEKKYCYFYYNFDGEDTHYCSIECLHSMMADEKDCYTVKRRRITVEERLPKEGVCCMCNETKDCIYFFTRYGISQVICEQACLRDLNMKENGRYLLKKRRATRNQSQAKPTRPNPPLLKLKVVSNATDKYLDEAYKIQAKTPAMVQEAREERERTFVRVCVHCHLILTDEEKMLTWEAMDYCNEVCLGKYQKKFGSKCTNCNKYVQNASLGKYCVRFGCVIRQFCNSACLEEFKKGLKICCYCQQDIDSGHMGFLAPVGDKGQFKDFCSQNCMEKFDQMSKNPVPQPVWAKCAVCSLEKATTIEVEVGKDVTQRLCSDPCFAAFKFVNNIFPDQCRWCKKYFERKSSLFFTIYEASVPYCFCSKSCMNIYISNSRHIVPCNWCKVKKYNFDMIRRAQPNGQAIMMCSLNCLNLYQVSVNAVSSRRIECDMCKVTALAQYHLTMSDATVRNFCTYQCVMTFQGQYSKQVPAVVPGESIEQPKAVPTGAPRRTYSANTHKNNGAYYVRWYF